METREKMIEFLIERNLSSDGLSFKEMDNIFGNILRNGFIGYANMLTADIAREYNEAINEFDAAEMARQNDPTEIEKSNR